MLFSSKKPIECPKGSFCSLGVQSVNDVSTTDIKGLTFTKILCPEGVFCDVKSKNALGTGPCQKGTYCTEGTTAPIDATSGTFVP